MSETVDKSALTYPMQYAHLRRNGHVVIQGRPCKIVRLFASKSKVTLTGVDIFTGKQLEDSAASTAYADIPDVTIKRLELDRVEGGYLVLIDNDGNVKNNVKLPEGDLGTELEQSANEGRLIITIAKAMGQEEVVSWKYAPTTV